MSCEAATRYPLVTSFLLVPIDTKPCGEHSLRWWVAPFSCEDLRSSIYTGWFRCGIGCCGACISRFCAMWLIMVSTRSIAARIVSMFYSTLFNHLACSSTSLIAKYHPLWVCSFAAVDVLNTNYWHSNDVIQSVVIYLSFNSWMTHMNVLWWRGNSLIRRSRSCYKVARSCQKLQSKLACP